MKKTSLACSILASTLCSLTQAGSLYLSPSIYLERISSNQSSYSNFHPEIGLGYATMHDAFYLAGEAFITPFSADISNNRNTSTYSSKITNSFGMSFLPGVMLTQSVLGYARLGFIVSRFNTPSVYTTGGEMGLGLQTDLIDNWSMRFEYDFTYYRTINSLGSPKSNKIGIGLLYHFT